MRAALWEREKFVVEAPVWLQGEEEVEEVVGEKDEDVVIDAAAGGGGGCVGGGGVAAHDMCAAGCSAAIDASPHPIKPPPFPAFAPPPLPRLMRARSLHLKLNRSPL